MENKTNVASNARRKHASSGEKRKHINRPAQATDDVSSCVPNINIMPAKVATQKTSPKAPPLSILGAVTAQKALRKFLSPSRRLLDLIRRRSSSRLFLTPLGFYRVPIQIAPTFQLQPTKLFKPDRLENFTRDIVHDIVQKHPGYSSHGTLAKTLCNDVRIAIQGIGPKRFNRRPKEALLDLRSPVSAPTHSIRELELSDSTPTNTVSETQKIISAWSSYSEHYNGASSIEPKHQLSVVELGKNSNKGNLLSQLRDFPQQIRSR